jgi:hypothetical protein
VRGRPGIGLGPPRSESLILAGDAMGRGKGFECQDCAVSDGWRERGEWNRQAAAGAGVGAGEGGNFETAIGS